MSSGMSFASVSPAPVAAYASDVESGGGYPQFVGAGSADDDRVTCVSANLTHTEYHRQHGSSSSAVINSPMALTFRNLRESDLPVVVELHRQIFPVQYTDLFFQRLFQPGYFCQVGVDAAGEIITFASARVVDPTQHGSPITNEAYIMTLGVRPSHRRLGLGAKQMEQILRLLRAETRATYAALHVKAANRAACGFYDRLGFTCDPNDGYLVNHYHLYGENWDACRYTRPLRSPIAALFRDYMDACAIL